MAGAGPKGAFFHVPTLLTLTKLTKPRSEAVRGGALGFCQYVTTLSSWLSCG